MAYDVVKFVDSIASSPTTRLDVNDGAQWTVRDFSAPPPRLRRSAVSNAMTDGAYVSSSTYDARTLFLEIDLITTTQDTGATELQKLARELDRSTNFLMYQPNALTKPVFFKTWRSDFSDVVDVRVVGAYRRVSIELLAEPFALGLRETVSVGTVNNDPAAGSNGCYFDVSSPKGDVAAPLVLAADPGVYYNRLYCARRTTGTPTDLPAMIQAESMSAGTETVNPGGGPDAAMSGAGTNNYMRTTFAGAVTYDRLSYTPGTTALRNALTGTFRILAVVRRTSATGTITVWCGSGSGAGTTQSSPVTLPATTSRVLVDLGIITRSRPRDGMLNADTFYLLAQQTVAGSNLDWDYVTFLPADESVTIAERTSGAAFSFWILDGESDSVYGSSAADVFAGTAVLPIAIFSTLGAIPQVVPGVTNRFFLTSSGNAPGNYQIDKADTFAVTAYYLPRYLYVRPSAT